MYVGNAMKHYLINGIVAGLLVLGLTPSMAVAAENAKIADKTNK
jgi:hypothetical protein